MSDSLKKAIEAVQSPDVVHCLFRYSASAFDEEDYDRLGDWYDLARASLAECFGEPMETLPYVKEPIDVERLVCWRRQFGIAFVLLCWGDNTRVRVLEVGLASKGMTFADI